jgi:hypothetical protein
VIRNFRIRGLRMLLGAAALLVTAGGIAYATIPSTGGVISGCYEKRTGLLRVIDAASGKTCMSFETPISWNQKGEQGLPGVQGEKGERGPQGPTGESGTVALAGHACPVRQFVAGFDAAGDPICRPEGPPILRVSPGALNFGSVAVGTRSTLRLTLENVGGAPAEVPAGVSLTGPEFRVTTWTCPFTLLATETCTADVRFEPIAPVIYSGSVLVGGLEVTVIGQGVAS